MKRLTEASSNVVCWSNDVLSLEKELAHGDVHNLIIVLREATGIPLEEAAKRVVEMHNAEVRDFIALAPDLPSFGDTLDANLSRYISILQARMRGNLDWSLESGRYERASGPLPSAVSNYRERGVGKRRGIEARAAKFPGRIRRESLGREGEGIGEESVENPPTPGERSELDPDFTRL